MKNGKSIKIAFFTILICLGVSNVFGQKPKTPVKTSPAKKPAAATAAKTTTKKPATTATTTKKPVTTTSAAKKTVAAPVMIADIEWNGIVAALDREDWTNAALLSSLAMNKLKTDNDKKQLAQLRYFYLYALAGKAANGKMSYAELQKSADAFTGKEFLMPSRQFLADCTEKVNYICAAKGDENAVRVTATNKSGSAIHSFEYVKLAEKTDVAVNNGKSAFLGGNLQKAEINVYKQNISIMRLIFDKGFVNIVASR